MPVANMKTVVKISRTAITVPASGSMKTDTRPKRAVMQPNAPVKAAKPFVGGTPLVHCQRMAWMARPRTIAVKMN